MSLSLDVVMDSKSIGYTLIPVDVSVVPFCFCRFVCPVEIVVSLYLRILLGIHLPCVVFVVVM